MKRFVCFLLAMCMVLGLFPMTATTASAASKLSTSMNAINILKEYEGFEKYPYEIGGIWYIGYGSEINDPDDYPNGISKEDALVLLQEHVSDTVDDEINKFTKKNNLDLSQNKHDALALFSYNYGTSWLTSPGHAMYEAVRTGKSGNEFINIIGQYVGSPAEDNAYFKGLMNRRLSEANMYLNNSYGFYAPKNYTYVILDMDGNEEADGTDKIIAYDYNKAYTLAENPGSDFLGWYVFDGEVDGKIEGAAVTKLDKNVAGKLLVAKFDDGSGFGNASYEIKVNTLVSRYVFNKTYERSDLIAYKDSMDELAKGQLKKGSTFKVDSEAMVDGIKWIRGVGKDTKGKRLEGWVYLGELPTADSTPDKPIATATITASKVDVREGATKSSDKLEELVKGQTVNIYQIKVEATATGNQKWGKVKVEINGTLIEGWINLAGADVKETANKNDSPIGREGKIINTEEVNVRNGAGTIGTNVLTQLKKGTKVTILDTKSIKNADGTTAQWGYVEWEKLSDGYTKGWVYLYYVQVEGLEHTNPGGGSTTGEQVLYTGIVTSNINLNVRCAPDIYAAPNGSSLPNGTKVNIYEVKTSRNMKWGRIGDDQWVCLAYVDLTEVSSSGNSGAVTTTSLQATVSVTTLDILKNYNSNAEKIGSLKKGDVLTVLERNTEKTDTGSRIWGRIIKDGVEGWINLAYVELKTVTSVSGSTGSVGSTGGNVTTNSNGAAGVVSNCISLNVRTAAGTRNAQITKLNNGTAVQVYERVTKDNAPWARITWNNGANEGWVCMHYITMSAAGTTPNTNGNTITGTNSNTISATGVVNSNINLKVRSGAGLSYPDFESLPKGTRVTVYEQVTNDGMIWGRINTSAGTGWICMSYVTVENTSFTGKGVMGTIARCAVAVNVRSAPGTNNALVGTIGVGKRVEVFESRTHGAGLWYRVAQGWVSADYVLLDSELPPGTALDATDPTTAPTQPSAPQESVNRDNEVLYRITGTINNNSKPLNVYNDTSEDSDKIGTVNDGLPLTILAVKSSNAELWGRIDQYATAGWVNMKYVTYGVHGYVNTEEQAVYANADTDSTVKGNLLVNTELNITKLNADGETVYGWVDENDPSGQVPAGLNGWIPMGRISDKPVDVIPVYKSSLDTFTTGYMINMPGRTNSAISAYEGANGTKVVFKMQSGVKVYVDEIALENRTVWGKVIANGVEGWINMASVTYVIESCDALKDVKVYKVRELIEDENLLGIVASGDALNLCELSFDSNGMLWAKVSSNSQNADLNGGYVRFTDENIDADIPVQYK